MNIYIATPIEPAHHTKAETISYAEQVSDVLSEFGHNVHKPWNVHIPNAWDLPNNVWGKAVFDEDIKAINSCDAIVAIVYDRRESTAGTTWELGYGYALGKRVIIVEHPTVKQMSLMLANGCEICLHGLEDLFKYLNDDEITSLPTEVC